MRPTNLHCGGLTRSDLWRGGAMRPTNLHCGGLFRSDLWRGGAMRPTNLHCGGLSQSDGGRHANLQLTDVEGRVQRHHFQQSVVIPAQPQQHSHPYVSIYMHNDNTAIHTCQHTRTTTIQPFRFTNTPPQQQHKRPLI